MKKRQPEIKKFDLDSSFHKVHKKDTGKSGFGLDNSNDLIGGGFGLYSTANMKSSIGPIKTGFYRIGLMRSGSVHLDIGLEHYHPSRNSMAFGFPGQTFSLYDPTEDFFAYYLLFKEEFLDGVLLLKDKRNQFPFLNYSGVQSFSLNNDETREIENFILRINHEIKNRKPDLARIIQFYIQLILLHANRSYERQQLAIQQTAVSGKAIFNRFLKLVNEHFLKHRKVSEYASLLQVTPDHLNRTIKSQSKKTAHELIDEMILIEAKAHLMHTTLSIAEIAYQLEFTDPSHFNKFFKKAEHLTPLQYRSKSQ